MTLGDHVASMVADQLEGISLDHWQDYDRLWAHRIANIHAGCWPARMKLRLLKSGHRAMQKMAARLDQIDVKRLGVKRASHRANVIQARFALWAILIRLVGALLPRCWCRKEDGDAQG